MTTTAEKMLDLKEIGRHTVDGREYVVYWDGAYNCVVSAEDWDAEINESDYPACDESVCTPYDLWCQRVDMVTDEAVLQAMSRAADCAIFDGVGFVAAN